MTNDVLPVITQNNDVAEGGREPHEEREPVMNVRRTSVVPAVKMESKDSPAAETGTVSAVASGKAGKEKEKDTQDSARSTAEVKVAAKQKEQVKNDATTKRSVLIIEDTTELAEILQASLEGLGLDITCEAHGRKGLDRFYKMNPDIVLLDIALPDMTGWQFLEDVKQKRKETDNMPKIIVITAHGDPANRLIGKFQNVFQYLIKPFTPGEVELVVRDVLKEFDTTTPVTEKKPVATKKSATEKKPAAADKEK